MAQEKAKNDSPKSGHQSNKVDVQSLKRATTYLGSLGPKLSEINARRSASSKD